MVATADAAVEEKAVVVIVFDAHITQLAVFSVVWEKQLGDNWGQDGGQHVRENSPTFLKNCCISPILQMDSYQIIW